MSKRQLDQPAAKQPNPKRQKVQFAREIQVQPPGKLPPSIDVEKFTEVPTLSPSIYRTNIHLGQRLRNTRNRGCFEIRKVRFSISLSPFSPVSRSNSGHRVWQTLPRHLRRRAASHDVRRVPARLRERARSEVLSFLHLQSASQSILDGPTKEKRSQSKGFSSWQGEARHKNRVIRPQTKYIHLSALIHYLTILRGQDLARDSPMACQTNAHAEPVGLSSRAYLPLLLSALSEESRRSNPQKSRSDPHTGPPCMGQSCTTPLISEQSN
jgi:hypothetical protein